MVGIRASLRGGGGGVVISRVADWDERFEIGGWVSMLLLTTFRLTNWQSAKLIFRDPLSHLESRLVSTGV